MSYGMTYQLTHLLHGLSFGDRKRGFYVADGDENAANLPDRLLLESHIRSGDYFSTLATTLDDLSTRLSRGDTVQHEELDKLVNDLLYIDRRYCLERK